MSLVSRLRWVFDLAEEAVGSRDRDDAEQLRERLHQEFALLDGRRKRLRRKRRPHTQAQSADKETEC